MTVTRAAWSDQAAAGLQRALGEDLDLVADQVRTGIAQLWRFDAAWLVTRIDHDHLVVVAFEGKGLRAMCEWTVNAARNTRGIRRIRFHTKDPRLPRVVSRYLKIRELERVYVHEVK